MRYRGVWGSNPDTIYEWDPKVNDLVMGAIGDVAEIFANDSDEVVAERVFATLARLHEAHPEMVWPVRNPRKLH